MNSSPKISIGLLLFPDFNSMACNALIDPFRAANYLCGQSLYCWDYLSLDGQSVIASNGMSQHTTSNFKNCNTQYDYLVVNSSWRPENFQHSWIKRALIKASRNGSVLVGLDTGATVLAYAGLLCGYQATVHYEHAESFRELFPETTLTAQLFCIDRDRITCCGGIATVDLSLELLHQHHGWDLANAAARYIYQERLRDGSEPQTPTGQEPVGRILPELLQTAVQLMQQNLEEPLRMTEVAHYLECSQRQLERLFHQHTGMTPMRYYLNLRIHKARGLLTQTDLSVAEVAGACGFKNTAHFSRAYRQTFAQSPSRDRVRGRVPFHFRSNPGFSSVGSTSNNHPVNSPQVIGNS